MQSQLRIFCDIDDTLVKFVQGYADAFGKPWEIAAESINAVKPWGWDQVQQTHPDFWANLEFHEGGHDFYGQLVATYPEVNLLTAYPRNAAQIDPKCLQWISDSKLKWMLTHCQTPELPRRLIVCERHEKKNFAGPWCVLIDDNPLTCEEWRQNKGYAIECTPSLVGYQAILEEIRLLAIEESRSRQIRRVS